MKSQNERSTNSQLERHYAADVVAQCAVEAPLPAVSTDRLYQVAALTTGIFLLATLL